jgi:Rieske Fe-S protein
VLQDHRAVSSTRVERRTVLQAALGLGLLRQDAGAGAKPAQGDLLIKSADESRAPLTPLDIVTGAPPIFAWAMDPATKVVRSGSRLNQILLVRLDPTMLSPETRARAADGVVAYTAICTHTGCDVSDWLVGEQLLACTCHASTFDPKDAARVVDGPAPRVLPALPLAIADGRLIVAGPFTSRVGFERG